MTPDIHTIAKALADALEKQAPFFELTESGKAAIAALAAYHAAVAATPSDSRPLNPL